MSKKNPHSDNKWESFDKRIKNIKINGKRIFDDNKPEESFKCQFEYSPEFQELPEDRKQLVREIESIRIDIDKNIKKMERSLFRMKIAGSISGLFAIGLNIYCTLTLPFTFVTWLNISMIFLMLYMLLSLWKKAPPIPFIKMKFK